MMSWMGEHDHRSVRERHSSMVARVLPLALPRVPTSSTRCPACCPGGLRSSPAFGRSAPASQCDQRRADTAAPAEGNQPQSR